MKRIESPSKRWAGYVILRDPLNYVQVAAIEDAQDRAVELEPSKLLSTTDPDGKITRELFWSSRGDKLRLGAILQCVSEWHIDGIENPTAETFPMTPRKAANELVKWLWDELYKIYEGEVEVPNES